MHLLSTSLQDAPIDHLDYASAPAAPDADGGWMISFVDILMLLLTLFVLLLAFHAVKQPAATTADATPSTTVRALRPEPERTPVKPAQPPEAPPQALIALSDAQSTAALLAALQPAPAEPAPAEPGLRAEPEPAKPAAPDPFTPLADAQGTAALLTALQTEPSPAKPQAQPALFIPQDVRDRVEVAVSADAVNLIIKDDVLFDPASAALKTDGHQVLDGIVSILSQNDYAVSVEGHTDDQPIHTARFPSNWDLSVARATHVTRYLIEHGIARQRLRAVGYADTRPLDTADTPEARAHNRRVSLVVHVRKAEPNNPARQARGAQPVLPQQGT